MKINQRVVITGMGALTPLGNSVSEFWSSLIEGKSGIRTHPNPQIRIPVGWVDFDFDAVFSKAQKNLLDRVAQMTLVAAAEAVASANLSSDSFGIRAGVLFGTGMGGAESIESHYCRFFGAGTKSKGLTVLGAMSHAAAAQLALRYKVVGECQTYTTGCSSSTVAIGEAFRRIRDGYLDTALVGGAECVLLPGMIESWKAMRVLCQDPIGEPGTGCRPFSADRNGFALGEGAGVLVLESLEQALARSAVPLCEIVGYGVSNDASHITNPNAEGQARAIQMALAEARIASSQVDHVNAHGTSTRIGDEVETQSLKMALGPRAYDIPISATKSAHGHLLGATGAVEMIAAVRTLQEQVVPPTTHWRTPDPLCDLDYVPRHARSSTVNHILFNSFAFGGNNASMILKRWS